MLQLPVAVHGAWRHRLTGRWLNVEATRYEEGREEKTSEDYQRKETGKAGKEAEAGYERDLSVPRMNKTGARVTPRRLFYLSPTCDDLFVHLRDLFLNAEEPGGRRLQCPRIGHGARAACHIRKAGYARPRRRMGQVRSR